MSVIKLLAESELLLFSFLNVICVPEMKYKKLETILLLMGMIPSKPVQFCCRWKLGLKHMILTAPRMEHWILYHLYYWLHFIWRYRPVVFVAYVFHSVIASVSSSCLRGKSMDRNIHCKICRSKLALAKMNSVEYRFFFLFCFFWGRGEKMVREVNSPALVRETWCAVL